VQTTNERSRVRECRAQVVSELGAVRTRKELAAALEAALDSARHLPRRELLRVIDAVHAAVTRVWGNECAADRSAMPHHPAGGAEADGAQLVTVTGGVVTLVLRFAEGSGPVAVAASSPRAAVRDPNDRKPKPLAPSGPPPLILDGEASTLQIVRGMLADLRVGDRFGYKLAVTAAMRLGPDGQIAVADDFRAAKMRLGL
jgi:hypothetical protein